MATVSVGKASDRPEMSNDVASAPLSPDDFGVCVRRGTRQIGGTCVELAYRGKRILLDLGLPLDAGDDDPATLLPAIPGVQTADPSLLALVLSHGHGVWRLTRLICQSSRVHRPDACCALPQLSSPVQFRRGSMPMDKPTYRIESRYGSVRF
jgi:hypothetical protein